MLRLLLLILCISLPLSGYATINVVATIKPIHSLVAFVMQGSPYQPQLLLDLADTPHNPSLRPSQARMLYRADIIFYLDDDFEHYMSDRKAYAKRGEDQILTAVELNKTPNIKLLPLRSTLHNHKIHYDGHTWLSTKNASLFAMRIGEELSKRDPNNKKIYTRNAVKLGTLLAELHNAIKSQLSPVKHTPFIVYHDAYQYFTSEFGLYDDAILTYDPEQPLSALHMSEVKRLAEQHNIRCLFVEPQFPKSSLKNLFEKDITISEIDPLGYEIEAGPAAYTQILQTLTNQLARCL